MMNWTECPAVECDANRVSGTWVFRGTRVPVRALFENLEDGASVDDFLEWFLGVQRTQAEAVLEHVGSWGRIPNWEFTFEDLSTSIKDATPCDE